MRGGQRSNTGDRTPSADRPVADKGPAQPPALSLPKGGGAIRGIDEKFSVNQATGTASLSIPVAVSPGRADLSPDLTLSYDSGAGNGPFGFGWRLSLPFIARKTDRGLPRYRDSDGADEPDVFILSGAEDLVPVPGADAQRIVDGIEYLVRR
jgi:hypothetical protein